MISSANIEPAIDPNKNKLDLLNEAFVLIFTYHLYPLTEFMTDSEIRSYVGTSLVVVTFLNIALNLGLLMIKSILAGIRKIKLKFLAFK